MANNNNGFLYSLGQATQPLDPSSIVSGIKSATGYAINNLKNVGGNLDRAMQDLYLATKFPNTAAGKAAEMRSRQLGLNIALSMGVPSPTPEQAKGALQYLIQPQALRKDAPEIHKFWDRVMNKSGYTTEREMQLPAPLTPNNPTTAWNTAEEAEFFNQKAKMRSAALEADRRAAFKNELKQGALYRESHQNDVDFAPFTMQQGLQQ